jgi:hypothetical protein
VTQGDEPRRRVVRAVPPHSTRPSSREVSDRVRAGEEVRTALDRIRRNAENWRTGMAGLLTLVTATLLFQGRQSINDYTTGTKIVLTVLVVSALCAGVGSLWLLLEAAYGRLKPVSAQQILDDGGVDVHTVRLAGAALADLKTARRLGLGAAGCLAAALVLSWYGPPDAKADAFALVVVRAAPPATFEQLLCGVLKAHDGQVLVLQVAGEPNAREIATDRLVSMRLVKACPG